MTKRKILLGALAVCLVAALAAGTLAYFTASDTATNTFMTATTDPDNPDNPDNTFGIKITETNPEDPTGERVPDGVTYEDVLPGSTYTKDPVVENIGAYAAYVRVRVQFDKFDVWSSDAYENGHAYTKADLLAMLGTISTDWTDVSVNTADDAQMVEFTFIYNKTLAVNGETSAVFEEVTLPDELDREQLIALNGDDGFHITVFGEAIQAANTAGEGNEANTIEAAKNAFGLYDAQMAANANP